MARVPEVPETRVLAIASHVAYGYVGNTMATFIMQSLGIEVTSINTVHYSNHTGYKQWTGSKTSADEILELYNGLQQSHLNDFDILLSGYIPSAEVVQAVGKIGRELRLHTSTKPGRFFWALDPVMGDNGNLYVPEDEVPAYKSLLAEADLILPNQFEAELLSGVTITETSSLAEAVKALHSIYRIPHVIVTSIRFSADTGSTLPSTGDSDGRSEQMTCIGSSATSDQEPRLFRVDIPALPVNFVGTGDMFAALTVARLRGEATAAGISNNRGWRSDDGVPATELPLARAVQQVLTSMQAVLAKTYDGMKRYDFEREAEGLGQGDEDRQSVEKKRHLLKTKAAEVQVVRNVEALRHPPEEELARFLPREVVLQGGMPEVSTFKEADELGVVNLGADGGGNIHVDHDKRWGP